MTSKNLFYNLWKENIKRRVWVMALSLIVFILVLPIYSAMSIEHWMQNLAREMTTIPEILISFQDLFGISENPLLMAATVGIAVVSGVQGYSFLFSRKKIDLYHSIPVKRIQLFIPIYINGILSYVIPYIIGFIITLCVGGIYNLYTFDVLKYGIIQFFLNTLGFLFLYTIAILAVIMTGTLLVSLLACFVFFFYEPIANSIIQFLYRQFFFTFDYRSNLGIHFPSFLSPLGVFMELQDKDLYYGFWIPKVILLSALCIALCIFLYRIRASEASGKAMAFPKTKAVIKVLLLIPTGLTGGIFFQSFVYRDSMKWFLLGIAISLLLAHCVIEIIYESDYKAALHHPYSLILSGAVIVIVTSVFYFDLFQYDAYLPKEEDIASISLSPIGTNINYYSSSSSPDNTDYRQIDASTYCLNHMEITNIKDAYSLAQYGILYTKDFEKNYSNLYRKDGDSDFIMEESGLTGNYRSTNNLVYKFTLKNGKEVYRDYSINFKDQKELFNKIFTLDEYKNIVFPLLSATQEDISYMRWTNASGTKSQWLTKDETYYSQIFTTYQEELRSLTIDDLETSLPVCAFYVPLDQKTFKTYSEFENTYYVFSSFKKTLALLEKSGFPIDKIPEQESIIKITVSRENYSDNSYNASFENEKEIQQILPFLHIDVDTYGNYLFFTRENLTITITYKDTDGTIVTSPNIYVFAKGLLPDFIKENLPEYK